MTDSKCTITSIVIDQHMIAYSINKSTPRIWDSENEETFFLEKPGMMIVSSMLINQE